MKYYWKGKLYRDTNSFDARYSKRLNYFLIFIDKNEPKNWESYSQEDYGYSDTTNIADTLRQKILIDKVDFVLLEQEN